MMRALPAAVVICIIILGAYAIGLEGSGGAQADTPAVADTHFVVYMGQALRPYDPLP